MIKALILASALSAHPTPSPKDLVTIYANVLSAYQDYRGIGVTQRQAVDTWVSLRVGYQPEPFYCVKGEDHIPDCRGWSVLDPDSDLWLVIVANDHTCLLETNLPLQMLVVIHSEFGPRVSQRVPVSLAKAVLPRARAGAIREGLCFSQ